ncbi:cytochrome C peroxidase [Anopheles sinensis]|uniref:Cytochrome C peroxidase n=1 Tax=Anopheles sinensis TaxID=74873 RepID=A0A084W7R7_ANOSI|nr:cytochrome C peroxidase [Anopheles sinensis]
MHFQSEGHAVIEPESGWKGYQPTGTKVEANRNRAPGEASLSVTTPIAVRTYQDDRHRESARRYTVTPGASRRGKTSEEEAYSKK